MMMKNLKSGWQNKLTKKKVSLKVKIIVEKSIHNL